MLAHRLGLTRIKSVSATAKGSDSARWFGQAQPGNASASGFDRCGTVRCDVHRGNDSGAGRVAGFWRFLTQTDEIQIVVLHEVETRYQEQGDHG